jgi:adenosylcobinamide-GDP ribazoletransferase
MPAVSLLGTELRALAAALSFLTRIPIGRLVSFDGHDIARAGATFPLIGAGLGAASGGIAAALAPDLSPLLAAAIALAAGTALTGALHLDALADTADALGADSRQRALEIMRDHTIGAYGVAALVLDLLIKTAALASLTAHHAVVTVSVVAGSLSRAAPVLLASLLPYARNGDGTGSAITQTAIWRAITAAALAIAIAATIAGRPGLVLTATAIAITVASGALVRRRLGGTTGDTLGATVELVESSLLIVAVAVVP